MWDKTGLICRHWALISLFYTLVCDAGAQSLQTSLPDGSLLHSV